MENVVKISAKTCACLDWAELLELLARRCQTARGQQLARALPFLSHRPAVELELDLVAEARALRDQDEPLRLGSVTDLREPLGRLKKEGALEAEVLLQIAQTLEGGARLRRFLQARLDLAPCLWREAGALAPLDDLSAAIRESFDENGDLSDEASPELGPLRRKARELHARLIRQMRGLMEQPHIAKFLQDTFYTQRQERYVLPVRTDSGSAVKGIVHGSSASGATMFVEPQEVVELNNKLKVIELQVAREELRILLELSAMVGQEAAAIQRNLDVLERLDVVEARAQLAADLDACRPQICDEGQASYLQQMHHPLMTLAGKQQVVRNDLTLTPDQALIITGPNAGGKTVALKTLGTCALMLRAGMHLPAGPDSRLPLFASVLTEMGDDQSLEQNLSTFTAHLGNLLDFLEAARPGALILLDEIGVGTDPQEGAALAQALLEQLVDSGAQLVVTTHFERLKSLPVTDTRFANAAVGFDMEQMQPTYRLHPGIPGSSGALDVARRLGLDPAIAERASQLLEGRAQDLAQLLTALAGERTRLEQQRQQLEQATAAAQRQQELARQERRRLEQEGQKALELAHRQAMDQLLLARRELERARQQLKRPARLDPQQLRQTDRKISGAAGRIRQHEPRSEAQARPARADELVPGARVLVPQLGGVGEVVDAPSRKKVTVRMEGGLKTQVKVDSVQIPTGAAAKKKKAQQQRAHQPEKQALPQPSNDAPVRYPGNTLDLRGQRVDEALAAADRFLDNALRDGEMVVFVIHGHGSGALRAAVREYLAGHRAVTRFEAAGHREGGDGVTLVWME